MRKRSRRQPALPRLAPAPVSKDWIVKSAQAAQKAFLKAGGDPVDPAGPLYQWAAMRDLDDLEIRFRKGDRMALMRAIRRCANHDLVMPAWVARAYISAFDAVNNFRSASWDEVFGQPLKKNLSLRKQRKHLIDGMQARLAVADAKLRNPSESLDRIFPRVGQKLGISKSSVRDYWYHTKRRS